MVYPLLIEVEIYFIVSSRRVMHSSTMAIFSHNSCDRLQAAHSVDDFSLQFVVVVL